MLGPTNRRRSRRLIFATTLAVVAQALLVMVSPLADARYHEQGSLKVTGADTGPVSQHSGPCPECMALQTLAIPGSPTLVVRASWAHDVTPDPETSISRPAVRFATSFPRAPPVPSSATL